jgi:hypothetical protein
MSNQTAWRKEISVRRFSLRAMPCIGETMVFAPAAAAPTASPAPAKNSLIDVILEDQARPLEQLKGCSDGNEAIAFRRGWNEPAESKKKPGPHTFPGIIQIWGVYP